MPVEVAEITQDPAGSEEGGAGGPAQSLCRKFYLVQPYHPSAPGYKLMNGNEFGPNNPRILLPPGLLDRGFRDYPVRPRFRVSRSLGRKLQDFESDGSYWVVSDRAKRLLVSISDRDLKFLPIDTEVDAGKAQIKLWLCDVMPLLNAVNEAKSKVDSVISSDGRRIHRISGISRVVLDPSVVGAHHIFRLYSSSHTVVCDEIFRDIIKKSSLTGLVFKDAALGTWA